MTTPISALIWWEITFSPCLSCLEALKVTRDPQGPEVGTWTTRGGGSGGGSGGSPVGLGYCKSQWNRR